MSEHNIRLADLEGLGLAEFDPAEFIDSDEAAAAYITQALETNDAAVFAAAVGDVARARGMAEIARASGLAREGLYKALRPNSQPRMETMTRVLSALNVRLKAEVIPSAERILGAAALADVALATPARKPVAKLAIGRGVRTATRAADMKEKVQAKPAAKSSAKPAVKSAEKKPAAAKSRRAHA